MRILIAAACVLGVLVPAGDARAIGCFTGGAAGAVAGHYAGHHAVLGAIAGCAAGHHAKMVRRRQEEQRRRQMQGQPSH